MFGMVTILKLLALSKCNYILQNIPVTKEILTKLELMLFRFLWKDKRDKIKRKQMIQSYENGGVKMIDVRSQLETFQIKWVQRLISSDDASWKSIPHFHYDKYGNFFFVSLT